MRRTYLTRIALGSAILLSAACSSRQYTSDYDPNASFSDLHTYQWAERPAQAKDDPRIYNAITESRVKTAVDRALQAKGFERVENDQPDFWVAWYGAIEGKMSYSTTNAGYGGWYGYGWYRGATVGTSTTRVNEWDEGTLVVDVIDADSKELIWRGSVTDVVDSGNRSPEEIQERFDEGAVELLASFPPGSGS